MPEAEKINNDEFNWIQVRKDLYENYQPETGVQKLVRKFKEAPLVPIGALATTACLAVGLYSMMKLKSRMSQMMMRARIVAQGFTVFALVSGVAYHATKDEEEKKT